MSLTEENDVTKLSALLKDVCNKLDCFKIYHDNIVTRCIYCGDSTKRKKNHGHFHIWAQVPVCYCFRCGQKVKTTKWLYDLENLINKEELDKVITDVRSFYGNMGIYSSSFVFSNDKIKTIDISTADIDKHNEAIELLKSRSLYDENIYNLIKHNIINVSVYNTVDNNGVYLGVKSLYESGYHLRDINSLRVFQFRNLPFDIFIIGSNFLASTVYIVEGLFDALAIVKMNTYFGININSYCIIVSNVGSHLRNLYYYSQINNPTKIIMLYDNDVDNRILTNHKRTSKWILNKSTYSNISFSTTKKYKDVNEVVINVPSPNSWFDYLVSF